MKNWPRAIYSAIAGHDESSWIGHWLVSAIVYSVTVHFWGLLAGIAASGLCMTFYANREGLNWGVAKATGKADRRKLRDGILDFAGPLLAHLLAWAIYLWGGP